MKQIFLLILLSTTIFSAQAQITDSITLEKCLEFSVKNMNISDLSQNNQNSIEFQKKNLKTNFLPNLKLEAQATYQSEALSLDIPIPGMDLIEIPLDQYKAYLELNQVIFDGGITKAYSEILDVSIQENEFNNQITTLKTQNSVSNIFFLSILLTKQEKIIKNQIKTLKEQLKLIESGVKNNILPPVNRDIIQSEILKIEQKLDEITDLKKSSLEILSLYTNQNLSTTKLITPNIELKIKDSSQSPTINLLNLQSQKIDIFDKKLEAQRMPKIYAFGQAGYGRPGLNMLSSDFSPYFIGGIKLSWNIYDWNNTKRNKQINSLKKESLTIQKQNTQLRLDIQKNNIIAKINSNQKAIEKDKKIINITVKILKSYDSQLKNGIITSSEYIIELNKLSQAKLQLELHKIQLEQLKFQYNNIF